MPEPLKNKSPSSFYTHPDSDWELGWNSGRTTETWGIFSLLYIGQWPES
jgi:hypothetical protein